jgi:prepilin-type N-terminal cleavage/methylation domain-containing protein
MRKGFSLVELMIVACIIGILAALVLPFLQGEATEAKISAAKDNLRVIRSTIELYAAQHKGVAPGYDGDDAAAGMPQEEYFRVQTTVRERYMRTMPENPFNNLSTIRMIADSEPFPSQPAGEYGWIYQPATGTIRLDWPGQDTGGIRYFDY